MIHSFLIVGGTKNKRIFRTTTLAHRRSDAPSRSEFSDSLKFDTTNLEPEEDKQAISIGQVRDLQHQLSLKPYAAKFKTGIILEAQRMTVEAQNALLKTLEEPPAHSVLILTAPSTKKLLPTIVSRCQIVRLRAEIDLDLESEEYKKGVEEFLTLLRQGRGERLAWSEENKSTLNSQLSTLNLLDIWISVLRDILLAQRECKNLALNPIPSFFILHSSFDPAEALEYTMKTKKLVASTNVSPRLALEVLLLDLPILEV